MDFSGWILVRKRGFRWLVGCHMLRLQGCPDFWGFGRIEFQGECVIVEAAGGGFAREHWFHGIFHSKQVTAPWAYTFIAIHHNVSSLISIDGSLPQQPIKYTTGWKDACAVFFYFLITIVMHAVVQEYIFDVSRMISSCLIT